MAYKGRVRSGPPAPTRRSPDKIAAQFEGDFKLVHHLAPPLSAAKERKGELVKKPHGPWMRNAFGLLAKMKGPAWHGFDIFGKTEERRTERALIVEYRACIDELLTGLTADKLALAVEIARIRRHPWLRPCQGAPPLKAARQVEWSDGAVAQPAHLPSARRPEPLRTGTFAVARRCQ